MKSIKTTNVYMKLVRLTRPLRLGVKALWYRYVLHKPVPVKKKANSTRVDVLGHYSFINPAAFGGARPAFAEVENTLNWVIPDFGQGSGGHINIFRAVNLLHEHGFRSRIIILEPCQHADADSAKRLLESWFGQIKAEVSLGAESMKPAWGTVATSWHTAYPVRDFQATHEKFYFVQDFEPYFYPHGSEWVFAENTYRFGFRGITAGTWLADKLARDYGMQTHAFSFSYDADLYQPKVRKAHETRHVFFYARPVTPRRAFEMGLLVLDNVIKRVPDTAAILAGWDVSAHKVDFHHLNCGIVPQEELAELYGQCDLALVLSFTNLSLLPLELMASGCPIVSNSGPNVEWLLDSTNSVLAEPDVQSLSDAIVNLLHDEERLRTLSESGIRFANSTSWAREMESVANYLKEVQSNAAA